MSNNSESKSGASISVAAFLKTDGRSRRIRCLTPLAASSAQSSASSVLKSGLSEQQNSTNDCSSTESISGETSSM